LYHENDFLFLQMDFKFSPIRQKQEKAGSGKLDKIGKRRLFYFVLTNGKRKQKPVLLLSA
jgi:hypothetical protein